MPLDPARTVDELRELRELTGDENGAQRVAWTDTWEQARKWLRERRADGAEEEIDEAGNQWFTLRGASDRALLIGGHIDSVPNGGWLDGCLNVLAGVEVLRRLAEEGKPPSTVRLVYWADEEGARFGRSLFGSSAAAGSMRDQEELRALSDRDGVALPDALAEHAVDLDRALEARRAARERRGLSRAAHRAGAGARVARPAARRRPRHVRRRASADHLARARPRTPARRRWTSAAMRSRAPRSSRSTSGRSPPRSETAPSARRRRRQQAGDRHLGGRDRRAAARPAASRCGRAGADARAGEGGAARFAAEENIEVEWERIWSIEPILFDETLIGLADEAVREVAGTSHKLPSARCTTPRRSSRAGIPTVMLFVQSLRGLSHTKLEDTKEEHLELSVQALDRLTTKTLDWLAE